jgi:putative ubiquitin-RnfH superfamily antitoxin RatB of RatAB toxin-antitoxin module
MSACLTIEVLASLGPRQCLRTQLTLPAAACVADALAAWQTQHPTHPAPAGGWAVGLAGRRVPPTQPLQAGDQLSLCRPLRVDPKTARRQRFTAQGTRRAGLFATRRPGAKPGY